MGTVSHREAIVSKLSLGSYCLNYLVPHIQIYYYHTLSNIRTYAQTIDNREWMPNSSNNNDHHVSD